MNKIILLDLNICTSVMKIRTNALTNIFKIITNLGSAYFTIPLILILVALCKKKDKMKLILSPTLTFLIVKFIQIIVQRPRPDILHLVHETSYSFPSAHSSTSVAVYFTIVLILLNSKCNKYIKTILIIICLTLIPAIALSRIYLGVHYFSDTAIGIILGLTITLITHYMIDINNK